MEIFTTEGITELRRFSSRLNCLIETNLDISNSFYSNQMVENLRNLVLNLIDNNNSKYWSAKEHKEQLLETLSHLDGSKGTFAPEVFNDQSLLLARIILQFIESDNFLAFFTMKAKKNFRRLFTNLETFLTNLKIKLAANLTFYNFLKESAKKNSDFEPLKQNIKQFAETKNVSIDTLTEANYSLFHEACDNSLLSFIGRASQLPYYKFEGSETLIDAEQPYNLSGSELSIVDNQFIIILELLKTEAQFNKKLSKKGLTPITTVYDTYSKEFSSKKVHELSSELQQKIDSFLAALKVYKQGNHLRFYQRIDPEKLALVDRLEKTISTILASQEIVGTKTLQVYKSCLNEIQTNAIIAEANGISVGQLCRLLYAHVSNFLTLFLKGDQTADERLLKIFETYRQESDLKKRDPVLSM